MRWLKIRTVIEFFEFLVIFEFYDLKMNQFRYKPRDRDF